MNMRWQLMKYWKNNIKWIKMKIVFKNRWLDYLIKQKMILNMFKQLMLYLEWRKIKSINLKMLVDYKLLKFIYKF